MYVNKTLKKLRKDAGLTQKELANQTGLSLRSIINYENGLREPNSKAMVALEKYFNVSGEFLRGEVDKQNFNQNNDIINDGLDQLAVQLQNFKNKYLISNQDEQLLASDVLTQTIRLLTDKVLLQNEPIRLSEIDIIKPLASVFNLNTDGIAELHKRVDELQQLPQYKK